MHEMSICMGIVESLENTAKENNYLAIDEIWLEIGPFSGVEIQAIEFCFDLAVKGSIANAAKLNIIQTKGSAWCFKCNDSVEINERYDSCPICGEYKLNLTTGNELKIKQITIRE